MTTDQAADAKRRKSERLFLLLTLFEHEDPVRIVTILTDLCLGQGLSATTLATVVGISDHTKADEAAQRARQRCREEPVSVPSSLFGLLGALGLDPMRVVH